jgi:hypothetical protein
MRAGNDEGRPRHRWPGWYIGRRALGASMRAVPRACRFRVAIAFARMLAPLVRRTAMVRARQAAIVVDGPGEIVLYAILDAMTRSGIEFDVRVRIRGLDVLAAAVGHRAGVLIVTPHTMLATAVHRQLTDLGYHIRGVLPGPRYLLGTKIPLPMIELGRTCLLEIRERLRCGEIVAVMIDRKQPSARTMRVETEAGVVHLAGAMIEVAAYVSAPVVFLRAWIEGSSVTAELKSPACASASDADCIVGEFAAFVRQHARRDWPATSPAG